MALPQISGVTMPEELGNGSTDRETVGSTEGRTKELDHQQHSRFPHRKKGRKKDRKKERPMFGAGGGARRPPLVPSLLHVESGPSGPPEPTEVRKKEGKKESIFGRRQRPASLLPLQSQLGCTRDCECSNVRRSVQHDPTLPRNSRRGGGGVGALAHVVEQSTAAHFHANAAPRPKITLRNTNLKLEIILGHHCH